MRGVWVDVDVELCCWCDITRVDCRTPHQDNFTNARHDFGCPNHRHSNVGQGPNWAQGYRTGVLGCQGLNNVVDRMLGLERHRRLRQYTAPWQIQSRLAVHIFGCVELSDHWSRAARIHGDISMTCQFADFKRIVAGQFQRYIASDTGNPQEIHLLR